METILPNNQIVDTKLLHLSTRGDAGNVQNGDYKSIINFSIPDAIVMDDSIDYIHFSIPYVVIPNSFYTLDTYNSKLVVLENSVTTTYIFPSGNYNANTFITKFKSLLPSRFNITLDNVNNKFTITNTTYDFSFLDASTIDFIMGFSGTISSNASTLTMPRVCNFMPLPRITLRCYKLANGFMSASNSSSDVILTIPNNAKPNGQIVYNNSSGNKTLFKLDKLSDFQVSITDDDGTPINFNGVSSFFVFQFDIHRKSLAKPLPFNQLVKLINSKT